MRAFIHDRYAPLSYKAGALGDGTRRPGVKSWVPEDDARRLAAYMVLAAICDNVGRYYLPDKLTEEQVEKYREYGHGDRLVVAARSALLGNEQSLHAPGAVETLQLEEGATPPEEAVAAQAAIDWLRAWAKTERLWLNMAEAERDTVGLGDGVWTLYWDSEKGRPRIRTYDPGLYFPVLEPGADNDFPKRVHLAWEENYPETGRVELHRLTFELGNIRPKADPDQPFDGLNYLYTDQGEPVPQDGDRVDAQGYLVRNYPWDPNKPSRLTCFFTHAIWDLRNAKGDVFNLDESQATYEVTDDGQLQRQRDLRLDFLPLVHVPNTPSRREHFGRSVTMLVAQILDDLSGTDTDIAESGALAGSATLVTKGGPPGDLDLGPGARLDLPVGSSAEYLDVSKNLDALLKLKENLKNDLSENSRISKATLGRVDGSNAVSGLALALSFSPTDSLVQELRSVRDEKYPLLLKFVLRMAQAARQLDPGPTPEATVVFGSYQPADKAQALAQVAAAVKAKVMSTYTAVVTLQQAGFSIEDAQAEAKRIRGESFAEAVLLLEASGDEKVVYDFLGLGDPPEPKPVPSPGA